MAEKASRLKIKVLRRFALEKVLDTTYKGGVPSACSVYEGGQVFYVEEGAGCRRTFAAGHGMTSTRS